MIARKVIYGCESGHNGGPNSAYLTRYTLLKTRRGQLCLHIFHRSDADVPHDHPWDFWSVVLWRGYREHYQMHHLGGLYMWTRNVSPLQFLFRPAEFVHRVELFRNSRTGREMPAITLVWMNQRRREWGFHRRSGWIAWREFFKQEGC